MEASIRMFGVLSCMQVVDPDFERRKRAHLASPGFLCCVVGLPGSWERGHRPCVGCSVLLCLLVFWLPRFAAHHIGPGFCCRLACTH